MIENSIDRHTISKSVAPLTFKLQRMDYDGSLEELNHAKEEGSCERNITCFGFLTVD
jgi:hypothetical protein